MESTRGGEHNNFSPVENEVELSLCPLSTKSQNTIVKL